MHSHFWQNQATLTAHTLLIALHHLLQQATAHAVRHVLRAVASCFNGTCHLLHDFDVDAITLNNTTPLNDLVPPLVDGAAKDSVSSNQSLQFVVKQVHAA